MKTKLKTLILALTVIVAFNSCDTTEELTKFDVNATFKPLLDISLEAIQEEVEVKAKPKGKKGSGK